MARTLLGLDLGGSAIKAGLVDVDEGRLVGEARSAPTPQPSAPAAVAEVLASLDRELGARGPIGFAAPVVVQRGLARTAANIDAGWIGCDGAALVAERVGRPAAFLNDADAAGLAESRFGAGRGQRGLVIVLTFGTGIGSAPFIDGRLVPNTEFGHMEMHGREAEHWASARIKSEESLDWSTWAGRVNEFLERMQALFWPDLFILGGAISERFEQFAPHLAVRAPVKAAMLGAGAGVIGAALAAAEQYPARAGG